jgi:hypothetical protein
MDEGVHRGAMSTAAPLLEACGETETLAEVGEWIVTYDSGEVLRARVRRRIA